MESVTSPASSRYSSIKDVRKSSLVHPDVDAVIKRAIQLYQKAMNDLYTSFEKDNDTYQWRNRISNLPERRSS